MHALGIEGTVRASFSFYNTKEEIDTFIAGVERVIVFGRGLLDHCIDREMSLSLVDIY